MAVRGYVAIENMLFLLLLVIILMAQPTRRKLSSCLDGAPGYARSGACAHTFSLSLSLVCLRLMLYFLVLLLLK